MSGLPHDDLLYRPAEDVPFAHRHGVYTIPSCGSVCVQHGTPTPPAATHDSCFLYYVVVFEVKVVRLERGSLRPSYIELILVTESGESVSQKGNDNKNNSMDGVILTYRARVHAAAVAARAEDGGLRRA